MKVKVFLVLLMPNLAIGPAVADWENGRDTFSTRCIAWHSFECNRAGPKLAGVINRKAGDISDFDGYSAAMKGSNLIWTEETLDAYLADPAGFLPGNGMAGSSGSIEDEHERRHLIAFLKKPDGSMELCP
jgi:cytochrome c